jgi:CRP/FNR family cyclic AMP-dependent transcriptional regulator
MKPIASFNNIKSNNSHVFSFKAFLDSGSVAKGIARFRESQEAYAQGDPATSVMYIQEGKVKLSVVNEVGKEAIVAILGPGDFFGEACLAGQSVRVGTATALMPTTVYIIQKSEMTRAIQSEHAFAHRFMSYLLSRKLRTEEDLVDQLFNSSEKRLARALLLLTGHGVQDLPQMILPKLTQEMLAEMVGTTRSRVSSFMNKFRKLGYIQDEGALQVNPSLLNVLLDEKAPSVARRQMGTTPSFSDRNFCAGGPDAKGGDELAGPHVRITRGGFGLVVHEVLSANRIDHDGETQTSHA